jgi:hypothetical protein
MSLIAAREALLSCKPAAMPSPRLIESAIHVRRDRAACLRYYINHGEESWTNLNEMGQERRGGCLGKPRPSVGLSEMKRGDHAGQQRRRKLPQRISSLICELWKFEVAKCPGEYYQESTFSSPDAPSASRGAAANVLVTACDSGWCRPPYLSSSAVRRSGPVESSPLGLGQSGVASLQMTFHQHARLPRVWCFSQRRELYAHVPRSPNTPSHHYFQCTSSRRTLTPPL